MKREDKLRQAYGPGAVDDIEEDDYEPYLDTSEPFDENTSDTSLEFGWGDALVPAPTCDRTSLLRQALILASRGWLVFPLRVKDKIPATTHGVKDASCDLVQVSSWWKREPDANIGVSCDGDFFVLDADDAAAVSFLTSVGMPDPTVWTPRGGHWYIRKSLEYNVKNSAKNLIPGIKLDTRSAGGYVVAPPSVHPSGGRYRWGTGETMGIPTWLEDIFRRKETKPQAARKVEPVGPTPVGGTRYGRGALQKCLTRLYRATEGERNNQLNLAAFGIGQLVGGGQLEAHAVETALIDAAIELGLSKKEATSTVTRALADGAKEPRGPKNE